MKPAVYESIAEELIRNKVINSDDKELYIYGLHQGIIMLLNILTTIVIGLALGMLWQCFLFMIAYIPLRIYAGGFHAKTQLRCYIFSATLSATVLMGIRFISLNSAVCVVAALTGALIICFFSPVEDKNKPLEPVERLMYKKRTMVILLLEIAITILFSFLGYIQISACFATTVLTIGFMLIAGMIKNKTNKVI